MGILREWISHCRGSLDPRAGSHPLGKGNRSYSNVFFLERPGKIIMGTKRFCLRYFIIPFQKFHVVFSCKFYWIRLFSNRELKKKKNIYTHHKILADKFSLLSFTPNLPKLDICKPGIFKHNLLHVRPGKTYFVQLILPFHQGLKSLTFFRFPHRFCGGFFWYKFAS